MNDNFQKKLEDLIKRENPFNGAVLAEWRKQLNDFNAGAAVCPLPNFRMKNGLPSIRRSMRQRDWVCISNYCQIHFVVIHERLFGFCF